MATFFEVDSTHFVTSRVSRTEKNIRFFFVRRKMGKNGNAHATKRKLSSSPFNHPSDEVIRLGASRSLVATTSGRTGLPDFSCYNIPKRKKRNQMTKIYIFQVTTKYTM
jgi:hypothetical protein